MATQIEDLLKRRILMVSGKGGVGKTTLTALIAREAADAGKRVLALDIDKELDAPSALLEMLCGKRQFTSDEPYEISSHLHCARLSPRVGQHDFLRDHIPVGMLASAATRSTQLNRFLMAAPGFQETGIIYRLLKFLRREIAKGKPTYEFILVDLPATGHALALTSLPQPLLTVFPSGPIERTIRESQGYFNDPKQTGCLIVTLPEPLPVNETFELADGLRRDKVPIAGILVNRLPEEHLSRGEISELSQFFKEHPREVIGEWSLSRLSRAGQAMELLVEKLAQQPEDVPVYRVPALLERMEVKESVDALMGQVEYLSASALAEWTGGEA